MLQEFRHYLYKKIPLTQAMGLQLLEWDEQKLSCQAPLRANINDKGSVFGGSSSALMIIAAWSLIKLVCDKQTITADIVIHKNETHWQKALCSDLFIQASFNKVYDFQSIKQKIKQKKHQRITCLVKLTDKDGIIYGTMLAKYVIIPKNKKG